MSAKMVCDIERLAKLAGTTRRTVRYYIQRGLLDPPKGEKRGSYYTEEHVERLRRIQSLSGQGVPLIHMKRMLDGEGSSEKPDYLSSTNGKTGDDLIQDDPNYLSGLSEWRRFIVAEGVELHFQEEKVPPEAIGPIRDFVSKLLLNSNGIPGKMIKNMKDTMNAKLDKTCPEGEKQ